MSANQNQGSIQCGACHKAIDEIQDARVRVRINVDEHQSSSSLSDRKSCIPFRLDRHGASTLHQTCWEQALQNHCGRKRSNSKVARRLLRPAAETAEFWDACRSLERAAQRTARLLQSCRHAVVFTGAGISTSAGIGDFRGLFGKWTEEEMNIGNTATDDDVDDAGSDDAENKEIPYEDLRPTLAHEVLALLVKHGTVKHVISQNCDGLHLLSGIPQDKLSELHGNVFVERCRQCHREFERPHYVGDDEASLYFEEIEEYGSSDRPKPASLLCEQCHLTHQTKRFCPYCRNNEPLFDTIINFGDRLRPCEIGPATVHSDYYADVMIVLGSTLTVTPAADLCRRVGADNGASLIICNRQTTPMDDMASVRVHGDCDLFLGLVAEKLLGKGSFEAWVKERSNRMKQYKRKGTREIRRETFKVQPAKKKK